MMDKDSDKAFYGYHHVLQANDQLAIDSLLITDKLFRNPDVQIRKQYVALVESVRENGGNVYFFSTLHVSGIQLQQVSGIAAILRFPLPDLIEEELDQDEEEEEVPPELTVDRVKEDMELMGF